MRRARAFARNAAPSSAKRAAAPPAAPSAAARPPHRAPPLAAERRQLTVMFCDLVGSTALATRLDPEDLREVIAAYHSASPPRSSRASAAIVAHYMGDGVLVYFGYPEAHEADAENAVRAGARAGRRHRRPRLAEHGRHQVRVGIATGLVVVGELVGAGDAQERNVVGETPNLAARLQSRAAPNTVLIADTTRRLAGELFEYEAIEPARSRASTSRSRPGGCCANARSTSRFEALRAAA